MEKIKLSGAGGLEWGKTADGLYVAREGRDPWCGEFLFGTIGEVVDFLNDGAEEEFLVTTEMIEDDLDLEQIVEE